MYNKILKFIREFRIIAVILTAFTLFWGWDAYQFVNEHYHDMSDYIIAFYISIVGVSGWVIKNWMSTKHNDSELKD